jgi:hypothetical protein
MKKFLRITLLILIVALVLFIYWRYFWVFGEGVKSGELNYVVKKGFIFKTFEGKLIQSGFEGSKSGTIQSYEFRFSVADDSIANKLMTNSGKIFELHYKEYMGALPWRGTSPFIVDGILSMRSTAPGTGILNNP